MQITQIFGALIGTFFVASFCQAAISPYVCKSAGLERVVAVTPLQEGQKAPCEVKYKKEAGEEKVIYTAQVEETFCETKAAEFTAKLTEMGWTCTQ